jgi:cobalamin biosynthesis protein CobD/CbiB
MSLFSLIAALLLEQFRPLGNRAKLNRLFIRYANTLERHLNAGEKRHGILAWSLAVAPPVLALLAASMALSAISPLLAWGLNIGVLYVTIGFKSFTREAGDVAAALRQPEGGLAQARAVLERWNGRAAGDYAEGEVAKVAVEQTFLCAYRQLFGTAVWFVIFGAAGAMLYYASSILAHKWGEQDEEEFGRFGSFAAKAFEVLDWAPLRFTALSFAVMGDFEDAVYCWRNQALQWAQEGAGILLSSAAGALGVRLGGPLPADGTVEFRSELGLGDEPDADYIDSAIGLVWRTLVLWLVLLLLLTLARWSGV